MYHHWNIFEGMKCKFIATSFIYFAPAYSDYNLALGKPTWQTSTNDNRRATSDSANAVDGNRNPDYMQQSCMHTKGIVMLIC